MAPSCPMTRPAADRPPEMSARLAAAAVLAAALTMAVVLAARQTPAPALEILSPAADAFLSGPTTLRARVEPASAVESVVFFVDGREICTDTAPPFECDWDAGDTVKARQIRVVANLAAGGRVVKTVRTRSLGFTEKVDVDVVQVTVTVMDGQGHFVSGLPRSAFQVYEDGRRQAISHFASENVPLELIVAVDISGSMTPAMPKLKEAVKAFLGAVPPSDQVTLLGFNDTIFTLTRRATNPADRIKAVDRLAPWGSTALYDVILRGVDLLGRQTGRKALVVFTDGEDQGSHAALADVERRLQSSDVTLYMIGQGRGVTMTSLKKIMERVSAPTGGRAFFTDSIDELHGAFDELLDELSNQYLLGYPPPGATRDDRWHRIKVEVDGHPQVRARQGYRVAKEPGGQ